MIRPVTRHVPVVAVLAAVIACPASAGAQQLPSSSREAAAQTVSPSSVGLRGIITDERSKPLGGVVVSALGSEAAFAISDADGHFLFRNLAPGPYLVRAHLSGYVPPRAKVVQVGPESRDLAILLSHSPSSADEVHVLQAGLGATDTPDVSIQSAESADEPSEIAWRLRHLKRSVLKDTQEMLGTPENGGSFVEDSLSAFAKALGSPVRLTTDFIAEHPLNGQINLLTRSSFNRPQDLFSQGRLPESVAFVSLTAPTSSGLWNVRGGTTQGDLSSWVIAGSSTWRSADAAHHYRAGLSYAMQRYLGGNADALVAVADGRRNVGEVYGFDDWRLSNRVTVTYGTRYARYDYLAHQALWSPSAAIVVAPLPKSTLRIRGAAAHKEFAPGAEEFLPPSTGLWLPPSRTFSPVSVRDGLLPERVDHVELSAEQPLPRDVLVGIRVFSQQIDDQIATLFGLSLPETAGSTLGHYYVGNSGDADVRGWGVSLSRNVEGLRASVDYSQADAVWRPSRSQAGRMAVVAPSVLRQRAEQLRDLTAALESEVPGVDTRVFVIYKINSGFAGASTAGLRPQFGSRFDVQVSQALPFMNFASGQWEMIVEIRNLFREDLLDSSVYDEVQVVRPPKHIVGGVTVRF